MHMHNLKREKWIRTLQDSIQGPSLETTQKPTENEFDLSVTVMWTKDLPYFTVFPVIWSGI